MPKPIFQIVIFISLITHAFALNVLALKVNCKKKLEIGAILNKPRFIAVRFENNAFPIVSVAQSEDSGNKTD